jgi:CBS domain-containing protein
MAKKGEASRRTGGARTVGEVMITDVVTIEPSASLKQAARVMDSENVGMLPVVEGGHVLGVVTDRDIVVRAISRGADPSATTVQECLTPDVHVAREEWTTEDAMKTMGEAQVGRLPVIGGGGQLVGVVTLSSIAIRAPEKSETLDTAREVSRRSARSVA